MPLPVTAASVLPAHVPVPFAHHALSTDQELHARRAVGQHVDARLRRHLRPLGAAPGANDLLLLRDRRSEQRPEAIHHGTHPGWGPEGRKA